MAATSLFIDCDIIYLWVNVHLWLTGGLQTEGSCCRANPHQLFEERDGHHWQRDPHQQTHRWVDKNVSFDVHLCADVALCSLTEANVKLSSCVCCSDRAIRPLFPHGYFYDTQVSWVALFHRCGDTLAHFFFLNTDDLDAYLPPMFCVCVYVSSRSFVTCWQLTVSMIQMCWL